MRILGLVLVLSLTVNVLAEDDKDFEDTLYKEGVNFVIECGSKELSLCFKEKALRYLENLPNNIDIGNGMKIKQNDIGRTSRQHQAVALPEEPRARENALDNVILERLAEYFTSHTFEFKLPSDTVKDMQRSVEEGRKKKQGGGNKNMGGMMMLIQMKAAVIGAIALKIVALVAFKALLVAKVALALASVIALKKLLEQKHHTSTYEVVAHPHYDEHGHYDRSFSHELAYGGQKSIRS